MSELDLLRKENARAAIEAQAAKSEREASQRSLEKWQEKSLAAEAKLRELATAVHQLNSDWRDQQCGDPKCGDDGCRVVQTVERLLNEILGTSYVG